MEIVKLEPEHVSSMDIQENQQGLMITSALANQLADLEFAFTAIEKQKVLMCGGLIPIWSGRAHAWVVMSENAGRHFISIHKKILRYLKASVFKRIEMVVDAEFPQGERWAGMLGFVPEGRMASYLPNGNDAIMYARINEDG